MIEKLYDSIVRNEEVRASLIELRQLLKEEKNRSQWEALVQETDPLVNCLEDADAKVRKNAALILGELGKEKERLYEAYQKEEKRFVKTSYLKALSHFDLSDLADTLKARLQEVLAEEQTPENKKHLDEEIRQLQQMVTAVEGTVKHTFCGYQEQFDLLLTTYQPYQQITADQIHTGEVKVLNAGVRVQSDQLRSILNIRTYREMLFLMSGSKKLIGTPEKIAAQIAKSDLLEKLQKCHKEEAPFYFRIDLRSPMSLEEKSKFAKKMATELEAVTGRKLINSTSDYEVEIRLMENKDGSYFPCYRMLTIPQKRFAYRKEVVSTSIHPSLAALCMRLAGDYLEENAQVLDPFCGVGTMLIERERYRKVRVSYGIDSFGEAIEKAKENTRRANTSVYYIHRDYFDFKHDHLFDEIITNMPIKGKKRKEEMDEIYASFFKQSSDLLCTGGRIIMYCNEQAFVKKQLRLHKEFVLREEFLIRKKDGYCLYVLEKKG